MRIAYIPRLSVREPYGLPPSSPSGAVDRVVYDLSEEMVRRGHDVTVFTVEGSTSSARMVDVLPRVHTDASDSAAMELRRDMKFSMLHMIVDVLTSEEFDVVHVHDGDALLGALRGRAFPVIVTPHGEGNKASYARMFRACSRDVFYSFISYSQEQQALAFGCSKEVSLGVVHHGVDIDVFSPHADQNVNPSGLVFVGRVGPVKGVDIAVDIALKSGMALNIIGPIADKALFDALPIDGKQIRYLGELSRSETAASMAAAAALVFPVQRDEAFGLVSAEALACGTPVIGYSRGALPEIVVDGVTGFLVDPGDVDGAVHAVSRLSEIARDTCRQHAERYFSTGAMAAGYERLYEKACSFYTSRVIPSLSAV